ncbi:MAG: hypothetical protein ACX93I_04025 [Winogradskyella sp.]
MMVIIVKLIIGIIIALSADSKDTYTSIESNNEQAKLYVSNHIIRNPRDKAFLILDNKCNVCHSKRNKRRVFTIENMDDFAPDIYEQVFVKKRMPKGRQIKLMPEEYQDILTWISTIKK